MKNKNILHVVRKTMTNLENQKQTDEIVEMAYRAMPPIDVESMTKDYIKKLVKSELKNSEPSYIKGQESFLFPEDENMPFQTAGGGVIKFGNATGVDMVDYLDRKAKHLEDAHNRYQKSRERSMKLIKESLSKNVSLWEAATSLDIVSYDENQEKITKE